MGEMVVIRSRVVRPKRTLCRRPTGSKLSRRRLDEPGAPDIVIYLPKNEK